MGGRTLRYRLVLSTTGICRSRWYVRTRRGSFQRKEGRSTGGIKTWGRSGWWRILPKGLMGTVTAKRSWPETEGSPGIDNFSGFNVLGFTGTFFVYDVYSPQSRVLRPCLSVSRLRSPCTRVQSLTDYFFDSGLSSLAGRDRWPPWLRPKSKGFSLVVYSTSS